MLALLAALLLNPPVAPALSAFLAPCEPQDTRSVTVEQIAAAGEAWLQRCVTVSGRTAGRTLRGADGPVLIGHDKSEVLGVDFAAEDDVFVTVTGRIDSCGRRERALSARRRDRNVAFVLHAGSCHFQGGAVLVASRGSKLE